MNQPCYVYMAIREHPWGREMLARLLGAGFAPALIIEEDSDVGEVEREKFERLGPISNGEVENTDIDDLGQRLMGS